MDLLSRRHARVGEGRMPRGEEDDDALSAGGVAHKSDFIHIETLPRDTRADHTDAWSTRVGAERARRDAPSWA
ncbi:MULTISPECIES: hypothetical protein [unclassified Streptomyces]|uniref:hypothetical protein n=1 Tax=unclassified Streptomyces TaxID=2593676 RepID=UPI0033EE0B12